MQVGGWAQPPDRGPAIPGPSLLSRAEMPARFPTAAGWPPPISLRGSVA